jgi:acylphosphatase
MNEKRVHVIVVGDVQGIGFRMSCQRRAITLGVRGWVRNRWDGSVEALFEGEAAAVDALVEWCRHGSPAPYVERVEVKAEPLGLPEKGFRVRL